MSQIIVSANELTRKKETLSALKKTLVSQVTQFEAEGRKLNSMWDGPAKKKYTAALTLDVAKIKLFIKVIEEFITVLSTIISMYKLMEKKNLTTAAS